MNTAQEGVQVIPIISVLVATAAFILSFVALWKTHFSRFRPISVVGDLGLRVYPVKGGECNCASCQQAEANVAAKDADAGWHIPSADFIVSVTNDGARPGRILGLRLAVSYPKLPVTNNRELFNCNFEVNSSAFVSIGADRWEWAEQAVIGDFVPYVVLPKNTVTKHFVFESRWDTPVVQDVAKFVLEMRTDASKKWMPVGEWILPLDRSAWGFMVDGARLCSQPIDAISSETSVYPPDLHKYTGSKEPLPQGDFERAKKSSLYVKLGR